MGRTAQGWTLERDLRTKNYLVRFTHAGRRIKRSCRTANRREAQSVAERIYKEVTEERQVVQAYAGDLDVLVGEWLVALASKRSKTTVTTYENYWANHLAPHFDSLRSINEASIQDYISMRLQKVLRGSVNKELSALSGFLKWAATRGHIDHVPPITYVRETTIGTPHEGGKREKVRVELTSEQALAIIEALPERSVNKGYPVRALFQTIWDTALRIGTIWRLEVPRHYRKGSDHFEITRDIDKNRYARSISLHPSLQAQLDEICPKSGLLFPEFNFRHALRKAALEVLGDEGLARHVSPHDFRHAALTTMASTTPDLPGIAHIAGHKHVTTTAGYVHANKHAADRVLDAHHRIPVTIPVTGPESEGTEEGESDVSSEDSGVGHPGLEPGANGLRIHCSTN